MKWIEAQGILTPDKKLTVLLPSSLSPGEYQVTLIIEEPANLFSVDTSTEISREKENEHN